jgi:hypothetical protein
MSEGGELFAGVFAHGGTEVSATAWLQAMLDTEAALARALERAGLATNGAGAAVTAVAKAENFDPAELGRQATRTGNPVPALVRVLHEMLPGPVAAAVHQGATSQDIIDTGMMLLARNALDATLARLAEAATAAARLAATYRDTPMLGRTLLQQAVPVTFGLAAAGWLTSLSWSKKRSAITVVCEGNAPSCAAPARTYAAICLAPASSSAQSLIRNKGAGSASERTRSRISATSADNSRERPGASPNQKGMEGAAP